MTATTTTTNAQAANARDLYRFAREQLASAHLFAHYAACLSPSDEFRAVVLEQVCGRLVQADRFRAAARAERSRP
jgi:hypothetical protein